MPGTFIFRPIEANLTHDTDWLGNMDPYCAYMVNNKRVKGQVCKSGGQHPIWNDTTTVPMEIDQPACVVELMDKDTFIDDSIGTFVVDLNEVRNNGAVSKWYPVFHKNKPAGQILFEAAFQPEGGYVQNTQPLLIQEVPKKAMVQETVITKQVLPQETYTQSTFISKGGVIPIGSENLDGGLYGKVVHAESVSHYPEQHLSGTQLHQETLPRTNLGGPLSGSLGGGVLGTRELGAQEFVGGSNYISTTTSEIKHASNQYSSTQYGGTNLGGTNLGGTNLGGTNLGGSNLYGSNLGNINPQNLGTQGAQLGNQYLPNQGSNLQANFNAAHISNAGLGGLYKESIAHPVTGKSTKAKVGQALPNAGNVIPGDLVGGHSQTNKNFGDQAL